MSSWIFLLLSFLPLSFASSPEPQYALIVPSVLHSDTSNQACVHLQYLNESVSLKILLDYNMDHYPLWEGPVTESHFYQCINFTAPPATSEPLAFVEFSVEGTTLHFNNRRGVALQNRTSAVFIQTDKPIYKPGQKVMFRIFTLNDEFKLVNKVYPLIYITDPQSNRIAQWKNQTSSTSFLQLELQLDEFPNLGNYRIVVADETTYDSDQWFEVKEYVLPTFSMKTDVPQRVSPFDEEFKVNVCAKYTYGQPVQGVVQLRVCRQRYYHPRCERDSEGICEAVSAQLDKDGCVSNMIQTKAFQLHAGLGRDRYFYVSLQVSTVLTENGTGIQKSTRDYVSVYLAKKSVSLEHVDPYYRRQIPYTGKIRLRDEDYAPIAKGLLFLEFDGKILGNFTTDEDGAAQFSIDTSDLYQPSYKLRVYHEPDQCTEYGWLETDQPEATTQINRFYSRTDSFVKVEPVLEELKCDEQRPVTVHYVLNTDHHEGKTAGLDFFYVLLNQGKIVDGGKQQVSVNVGHHGTFSILLDADEKLSPRAKLMVYILHDNELVADSISFEVEKCFRNKVSLEFSEKKALPASTVELNIEAASNSICALRAIDKSILLLKPGGDLSPGSVQSRLSHMPIYGYYFGVLNLDDELVEPCIELKDTFSKGLYYLPVNVTNDGNVFDIVKELGLKVFTSSSLRKPVVCKSDLECKKISSDYSDNEVFSHKRQDALAYGGSAGGIMETVRQYFPETWIWNTVSVDSSGKASLPYTVPDTITEWEANMLCVDNETGFGISKPAQLTAFQPFFVELALPYSIVRKESFLLKGNAFNYMNVCSEISTMLAESQDYKAENLSPENDITEVCPNERKTHTWRIHAQTLGQVNFTVTAEAKATELSVGRRDTVIRSLLVEPEGVKKEVTQSSLICVKGASATELVSLQLPENLVEDSAKAYVSVLGDVMGTAMSDAENFLRMPTGCGEQNIAMFLANLAVLNYLNDTKQLTEEKRSMFVGRLSTGYQRQLSYRIHDGSFTTYGNQFEQGNLWVTVLTYKALALSKEWIYVDDNVLDRALILIASKQNPDGCFRQTGDIFNNAVKEGENYSLLLTARVAAALLEAGRPSSYPVVQKCLSCLDTASAGGADVTYEKALLAYTYSLAEDEERRQMLLEGLKNVATKMGGLLYWEREIRPAPETFRSFYPRAPSADIEMTSYALLAFLSQPTITQELLTFASQVAQWLVRQQNPYGGFASSQDTHVALQALSRYGVLTFTKDAQNTVVIKSAEGTFQTPFQVNSENRVLLQRVALPNVPGDYNVEVQGSGCAYVQTTLRYNVILPSQASGFSLAVRTSNPACMGNFLPRFELVLTASYTGKRNVSNMAIVDIKMLSGFVPVESSLQQLSSQVMRREIRNDHMLLYLRNVSSNTTTLTFMVEESFPVNNNQPAQIRMYDYYETDESAMAEYNTACPHSSS
ncbi:ovostatin-like isoform X2 [Sphaerodactylus townsendi]|uniref:ovostatin-like isoform X2 n=1 Tax=Sphaerodactylus townsendi TaxID=933632 RepID=UPI0020274540|nr:ovostatin-like isoform X2 [Sphaerodactylus townsendi]